MPEDITNQEPEPTEPDAEGGEDPQHSLHRPNKDKMTGPARKLRGMPAAGGAFEPDAAIAAAPAGMRSGIAQARDAGQLLPFVQKYGEYYEAGDPNVLAKQIEELDELPSEQASMRIKSINHALGKIHAAARDDIKKKVAAKLWPQYFPKHTPAELKAFIKKAKASDLYQRDMNAKEKIDRLESNIFAFNDKLDEVSKTDPEMMDLDRAYSMVVGGRSAARHFGSQLAFTTKGGEAPEKTIAKKHQPMRPVFDKGDKDPSGFIPVGPAKMVPKPLTGVRTDPKWAALSAQPDDSKAKDVQSKIDKLTSKDRLSAKDKEAVKDLKYQHAMLTPQSRMPIVRKKQNEALDRFFTLIIETAAADRQPKWWDEL